MTSLEQSGASPGPVGDQLHDEDVLQGGVPDHQAAKGPDSFSPLPHCLGEVKVVGDPLGEVV
jgi:hypothetical protein